MIITIIIMASTLGSVLRSLLSPCSCAGSYAGGERQRGGQFSKTPHYSYHHRHHQQHYLSHHHNLLLSMRGQISATRTKTMLKTFLNCYLWHVFSSLVIIVIQTRGITKCKQTIDLSFKSMLWKIMVIKGPFNAGVDWDVKITGNQNWTKNGIKHFSSTFPNWWKGKKKTAFIMFSME